MNIKKPIKNVLDSGVFDGKEVSLQSLKPMFGLLFDHSEDAVIVVGADDDVVYVNYKLLQLAELTAKQVLGKRFSAVSTQYASMQSYASIAQKITDIKKSTTLSRIVNVADSLYEIVTISPIINSQHSILGVVSIGKQITIENPLSEQEVRRMSFYQKTMIDSIPFMMWLKDKNSRMLVVNAMCAEVAGMPDTQSLKGKTDADLWPEALAKGYVEDDLKVLDSGEPMVLVEQVKKKNGETGWVETYKAPVVIDGKVVGTVGYARDIDEQKELHSEINQKELEYNALIKSLPLSIVRYDSNCKRVFVNATKSDFIGNDLQSLLGKTPKEQWNPNITNITAEEFQHKLVHVLQNGGSQTFELHCKSEDVMYVNVVNLLPEFGVNNQVTGVLAIVNDVTEISKYRHDLEHMAYHDALTSLPNRALLNQRLQLAAAGDNHFGLMFMDLDYFKTINDTLGHVVGDALLLDVAKRITASVRGDDLVARIGGDEFAILVTNLKDDTDLAGLAIKIAEKLSQPFNIEGINFFVTASIGIACYPTDSEGVEDLIKFADTAMYDAKKQGRNNYQFYTPELTQSVMEHLAIATALRYAIQKNELSLLYQPKVDIATGRILGAEALLRWHGNVLGQIQPEKFIPIAEESGLIIDIGAWVLRASCETAVQLNKNRTSPLNIAINVSSKEFSGNNYIENLQRCLLETGCQPAWITLEITESLLLHHEGKALETLTKIDEMGVALSIDDFGTGYSALAYLSKFPIRQVKIDRSFVTDICNTPNAALLVKAIIAMTLSLNKELVAEGIETQEQAALIKEYGCNQAQGYLYSKPIPFNAFLHLVAQQKIH